MRSDMHKVIVERPRVIDGDRDRGSHDLKRERLDPESAPTKESMRRHNHSKSLNENLNPLKHYLKSNVGRPWSKVYSEIRANLRATSAVQAHVLQHLRDCVEEHPLMIDGFAYYVGTAGPSPIAGRRWSPLYVCPRTGLLKVAKRPRAKKPRHPPPHARRVDDLHCAVWVRGCWHLADMRRAPMSEGLAGTTYATGHVRDAVLGNVYSCDALAAFYGRHRGAAQYAVKLRALTRDEIKRLPF